MIVLDTSAIISLAAADTLGLVAEEFDVHTTDHVIEELEQTAEFNDSHGKAASTALTQQNSITIHRVSSPKFETSRIDVGEGSCAKLADDADADFLVTDDLRALPELQNVVPCRVAISPIVLRALVKRNCLTDEAARDRATRMANRRGWLGTPIYRRAIRLLDES